MSKQYKVIEVMIMSNLVFYEGWADTLRVLSKKMGVQFAKDAAWEIINYGTKGKYWSDDEDLIEFVRSMCSEQIEASQKRYSACKANGTGGGRPKKYDNEEIIRLHDLGLSNQDIADNLLCSVKTVERALKNYENGEDEI